jgi:hypothetical protein
MTPFIGALLIAVGSFATARFLNNSKNDSEQTSLAALGAYLSGCVFGSIALGQLAALA